MNTSRSLLWRTSSAAFVAITYTLAGCAGHYEPRAEYRTARVSYADLDLSTPAGARTLYQRVKAAARRVCAPLESREARAHEGWRECYDHAISQAVIDVDRQTLTALHGSTHDERSSVSRPDPASTR